MKQIFISIGVLLLSVGFCFAQPRPIPTEKPKVSVAPAPPMFAVKYEGGMFGYSKKEPGTVKFDDDTGNNHQYDQSACGGFVASPCASKM